MFNQKILSAIPLFAFCLMAFTSCNEGEVDYRLDIDFIYINETSHDVSLNMLAIGYPTPQDTSLIESFSVHVGETKLFEIRDMGNKYNPLYEDNGILMNVHEPNSVIVVKFGNDKCITYPEYTGPSDIHNYEGRVIEENRYLEYTYRFTQTMADTASVCE